ncbi:2-(1,2-epoxy-1,2-dihydrophenyl)acetyl-CoA isomerase PaaG [Hoeflea sp.]|uniref:2-(1,2-epoxy-1,2-dihydrophenyl)acetyl-CoA isomerase PaaG n=1 Tax=Hoeflea sp. TaxID=1940281 RepID=UPI0019A0CB9D|nr:2-(1,2-epoxy-1,2-dihydrophenyl)acetyl-CoA isomerase PaaG [Hoeflea sp.]MBC7285143.1 2-(1,2-epoxy-1,2-dihydrophenyl)acetyl-CoA isomerase [Hoeflea sp.]
MSDTVLHSWSGGVLEITLNRPDRLNAFNDEMHGALAQCFDTARDDARCRAVLLTGAGRGFCAGQDLSARDPDKMGGPPDLGDTLIRFYNPLIRRIRSLEKPIVCAVNGVAAGAGANLALACDIVLAARGAKFIQSFARVGLIPDAGGTWMLPRLIGEARAKAIAMTAEPVTAERAEHWGMIWKAVDDAALMDEARSLAAKLAAGPTFGLGRMKSLMHAAAGQELDPHLDLEAETQRDAGRSADYAEGVRAFLEKREPNFGGTQ